MNDKDIEQIDEDAVENTPAHNDVTTEESVESTTTEETLDSEDPTEMIAEFKDEESDVQPEDENSEQSENESEEENENEDSEKPFRIR